MPSGEPSVLPRIVWTLWLQGWAGAPDIVQACLASWRRRNPEWRVHALDEATLHKFLPHAAINRIHATRAEPEARSDQIRIELLCEHGGVWADATTMCALSLDQWLPTRMTSGFFAFARPGPDRMLASWFLAASEGSYIVNRWRDRVVQYWHARSARDDYFWFHKLFASQYTSDTRFRELWDAAPTLPAAHICHFAPEDRRLISPPTQDYIGALRSPPSPVFKLTHKLTSPRSVGALADVLCSFGLGESKPPPP